MTTEDWTVTYWLHWSWGTWHIDANYGLMFPSDGEASWSIGTAVPGRYLLKSRALDQLRVLEFKAKYGEPKLYKNKSAFKGFRYEG